MATKFKNIKTIICIFSFDSRYCFSKKICKMSWKIDTIDLYRVLTRSHRYCEVRNAKFSRYLIPDMYNNLSNFQSYRYCFIGRMVQFKIVSKLLRHPLWAVQCGCVRVCLAVTYILSYKVGCVARGKSASWILSSCEFLYILVEVLVS